MILALEWEFGYLTKGGGREECIAMYRCFLNFFYKTCRMLPSPLLSCKRGGSLGFQHPSYTPWKRGSTLDARVLARVTVYVSAAPPIILQAMLGRKVSVSFTILSTYTCTAIVPKVALLDGHELQFVEGQLWPLTGLARASKSCSTRTSEASYLVTISPFWEINMAADSPFLKCCSVYSLCRQVDFQDPGDAWERTLSKAAPMFLRPLTLSGSIWINISMGEVGKELRILISMSISTKGRRLSSTLMFNSSLVFAPGNLHLWEFAPTI